jgi:hypothetical protein
MGVAASSQSEGGEVDLIGEEALMTFVYFGGEGDGGYGEEGR